MLKVLLSAYACEPNKGSESGVGWNWAIHLSAFSDVTVVTRTKNRIAIEKEFSGNDYQNISFKYYDLPNIILKLKPIFGTWIYYFLWQFGAYFYIKKNILEKQFDIAHHVTFMSNKLNVVPFLGFKNVVGPVGGLEILPKEFCAFTGQTLKENIRNLLIKRYRVSPFYKLYLAKINRLVLTSNHNVQLINKTAQSKIRVMQIGSTHIVAPQNGRNVNSTMIQLYWGGILERWKGLELLLRSLITVKNEFHLSVTGKGKDEYYFRELTKKLGLDSKISFHGWLENEELNILKQKTNLFIFTSLRETTGSILLEMMGRGKACVVLNIGGPSEICNNGNSVKIDVKNIVQVISDLSKAIDFLIENHAERERIGLKAYDEINKNYNWDNKAKRMVEIYKEVLNENTSNT